MSEEKLETGRVLTILAIIIGILSLLVSIIGGAFYFARKHRRGSSFAHARLNDNVEITNPMYLNDVDDAPAFVHEPDKVTSLFFFFFFKLLNFLFVLGSFCKSCLRIHVCRRH